jgi:1-aminocyclopropane-1-carboxylate deaminase/D-cysteine desulfhydrase-like pyridoxal-dependent ACC family enzyme
LRSLQEIQLDFVKEAKAYAGLWSQRKKKEKKERKKIYC